VCAGGPRCRSCMSIYQIEIFVNAIPLLSQKGQLSIRLFKMVGSWTLNVEKVGEKNLGRAWSARFCRPSPIPDCFLLIARQTMFYTAISKPGLITSMIWSMSVPRCFSPTIINLLLAPSLICWFVTAASVLVHLWEQATWTSSSTQILYLPSFLQSLTRRGSVRFGLYPPPSHPQRASSASTKSLPLRVFGLWASYICGCMHGFVF